MNSRWPDYLLHSTAMLNSAIRVVRNLDDPRCAESIELWSEQVKRNMALISGAPDPENAKNGGVAERI